MAQNHCIRSSAICEGEGIFIKPSDECWLAFNKARHFIFRVRDYQREVRIWRHQVRGPNRCFD